MKIEIKNISKSYGKHNVLKNITFTAEGGKCIGILGGNGCGKSTLFSILAGIQNGDSGDFLYDGNSLFKHKKQRSRLVGYVPQGTPLFEELTAYDNLLLWYKKSDLKVKIDSGIFKLLKIKEMLNVPVSKMSGGMKKRLSIACSVSENPPLLLLDEPMSALDISCKQQICDYLNTHKKNGGIIFIATHDVMELDLCDECYVIKDGVLVPFSWNGNLEELVKWL